MQKTITIEYEGKEYSIDLKATAATFLHYKAQFGRDGLKDMKNLVTDNGTDYDIDTEAFYGLLWSLAYSANKKIKPLDEWLEQFDVPPVVFIDQVLPEVASLLTENATSQEQGKN